MSIGKTFVSHNYGQEFELSDGSIYVDTYKSPKPVSLLISFIEPGPRQTIKATVSFNRRLESASSFSNFFGVFRYDGDEEIDGNYICLDHYFGDTDYEISCEMAFDNLSGAGVDVLEYTYTSGARLSGVNGINVDDFSVEEINDYPTPISTSVIVNGPKIEVSVTFDKELNTETNCDITNFSLNYNDNVYSVISCSYLSSNECLITGNYSSSTGENFLFYNAINPYGSGFLIGTNGTPVRTFKITL